MDLVLVSIQFLVMSLLVSDRKIMLCSFCLALIFLVQYHMVGVGSYYVKYAIFDMVTLCVIFILKSGIKRSLLFNIVICSLLMNIYEGMSYYQTFIYPYRDVIQWWMIEVMFIILAWNCNWRGISNVKLRRINN